MAIRKIVLKKDPILRKQSKTVKKFDEKLWELLDDMAETMYDADGVGLAAVQVASLKRAVIVDIGDERVFIVHLGMKDARKIKTAQQGAGDGGIPRLHVCGDGVHAAISDRFHIRKLRIVQDVLRVIHGIGSHDDDGGIHGKQLFIGDILPACTG